MKNRRKARILTVFTLYGSDMRPNDGLDIIFESYTEGKKFSPEAILYSKDLITYFNEKRETIDALLQKHAAHWKINRMAAIERNILRMSITELYLRTDIPFKVVIDEAVEIAKIYGSSESGKFVNGILDAIHRELSAGEKKNSASHNSPST